MEDFCSPCKFRHADTMAIKYCITCQEPQCKACYSVHKSSKATRKHLMVDISDVNKNSKIDQDLKSLQYCAEHKKELEFYCTDHKHLLCSTCLLRTNGLECKAIVEISSAGEHLANSMFNNQIKTDLDSVLVHCIEENRKIQSLIQSGKNERINIQRQFQHIKQKVAMVLEKYEIRVLEEVNHNIETQLMELNQHLATFSDTLKTAKDNKAKLQAVVENGSKADIFRCTLSISEQLDGLRVSNIADKATVYKHSLKMSTALSFLVKDTYPVVKCETIKYSRECAKSLNISGRKQELSNIVEQVMLKTDRNKLPDCVHCNADTKESGDGIIKDDNTELKSVMLDEQRQAEDKTALVTNALETGCSQTNIRIAHVSDIQINTIDDRLPTIDGITTLHDGRLILSDQSASRLIILKENFTYDHELDFSEPPGKLTVLTHESLAVCLPTAKTVTIISTDSKLKRLGGFKTKHSPVGIYATDKNRIFVSSVDDNNSWFLNVLTPSGATVVTIKNMQSVLDAKHISSLIITNKCRYYIFCCNVSDCVYCVQANGKEIFRYKVKSPNGLYVDEANYIYVVDSLGTLHLLSANGELLQKVHIPAGASGITYYPVMDRLVVTRQNESEISVYCVKR